MRGSAWGLSHLFSSRAVCHTAKQVLKITLLRFLSGPMADTYSICFHTCSTGVSSSCLFHSFSFPYLTVHRTQRKVNLIFRIWAPNSRWDRNSRGGLCASQVLSNIPLNQHDWEIARIKDEKTHSGVKVSSCSSQSSQGGVFFTKFITLTGSHSNTLVY